MIAKALKDVISSFEVPLPDSEFAELVAVVGRVARKRPARHGELDAAYFYLLGRTYELLGYCARHTPWLSNSHKFYWQSAVRYFELAMEAAPAGAEREFLRGKFHLRAGMIHMRERNPSQVGTLSHERLATAVVAFRSASDAEKDARLNLIYSDARFIAETEADQLKRMEEVRKIIDDAETRWKSIQSHGSSGSPSTSFWLNAANQVSTKLRTFPKQAFRDLPSVQSNVGGSQPALAEARELNFEARVLEEVVRFLQRVPRDYRDSVRPLMERHDEQIIKRYEKSAKLCDDAKLTIRAAHTRVTMLRRGADAELGKCIREFSRIRAEEDAKRKTLLARTPAVILDALPGLEEITPNVTRGRVPAETVEALAVAGTRLGSDATIVSEARGNWVISDAFARYHMSTDGGRLQIIDLTRQPIPFTYEEAGHFAKYAKLIHDTTKIYTDAIREIRSALKTAEALYADMTLNLKADTAAIDDVDLDGLKATISAIYSELESQHYPLLSTLQDRIQYAWSLLEMFQMRHGAVRLGTLFSAQCQLVMANPHFDPNLDKNNPEEEFLEVGADPVFRTTVDFVFRGAKGEEDLHESQRLALKASIITIGQEWQSFLSETRWIELPADTRNALIERFACHRSLAQALSDFTHIFVVQQPGEMKTGDIKKRLETIRQQMRSAEDSYEASSDYPSRLIDRNGLRALLEYMNGIAYVLIGMNQHLAGEKWAGTYQEALWFLGRAKAHLEATGDVYLLPRGKIRDEYLAYIEARILTVEGWEAWYHADDETRVDRKQVLYTQSVASFEKSAEKFRKLGDYRVATKAKARAIDVSSFLVSGDERKRRIMEANYYYAACANEQGFRDTARRLQDEFPESFSTIEILGGDVEEPSPIAEPATKRWLGEYEIEELGWGGMAIVYRATKPGQKPVALKSIRRDAVTDKEFVARFQREVAIGKSLTHPNIVQIFESGAIDEVPYFTMELLEGSTLKDVIAKKEPCDPRAAAKIALQIAAALHHAHLNQVVHRDLKPSNVMLLPDGTIKVMDFGIAYSPKYAQLTQAGMFIGTLEYAAPEHLQGKGATSKSDLYALGLILYELLTGKIAEDWRVRMHSDHPAASASRADVPRELDGIVTCLLARDPADRYADASEVASDLRAFVGPW